MSSRFIDAEVWPEGSLEVLSQFEIEQLQSSGTGGLYPLLRRCMLAVLNSDSHTDDARALHAAGFDAVLVGETLVTSGDPSRAVADLIG